MLFCVDVGREISLVTDQCGRVELSVSCVSLSDYRTPIIFSTGWLALPRSKNSRSELETVK